MKLLFVKFCDGIFSCTFFLENMIGKTIFLIFNTAYSGRLISPVQNMAYFRRSFYRRLYLFWMWKWYLCNELLFFDDFVVISRFLVIIFWKRNRNNIINKTIPKQILIGEYHFYDLCIILYLDKNNQTIMMKTICWLAISLQSYWTGFI